MLNKIKYTGIDNTEKVKSSLIKSKNIESVIRIPLTLPSINSIIEIIATANIVHCETVSKFSNYEARLFIVGEITLIFQYQSKKFNQDLYCFNRILPFCEFLILPKEFKNYNKAFPTVLIENIFAYTLSPEKIYIDVNLSLLANI